jgi:hypothetical protein
LFDSFPACQKGRHQRNCGFWTPAKQKLIDQKNQGIPKSHERHTVISLPALQLCLGVDGHLDEDGVDGDCAAAVFVLS